MKDKIFITVDNKKRIVVWSLPIAGFKPLSFPSQKILGDLGQ